MPIYMAPNGSDVVIRNIRGTDKVKTHLLNLGFVEGESVTLVSKVNENVIVKIKGVTLGLSHDLAKRILI